jgi:nucleoid DNA-binding protein
VANRKQAACLSRFGMGKKGKRMNKSELIEAVSAASDVPKENVKAVIEHLATVGYKELKLSGEFTIPGFAKF